MSYQFSFEKLKVWQKAKELALAIYKATKNFPKEERFGLISQLRRSTVSVATNLAEGSARNTPKDKAHFTTLAYTSLMESANHVIIAYELDYLDSKAHEQLREQIEEISRMLTAFKTAQLSRGE